MERWQEFLWTVVLSFDINANQLFDKIQNDRNKIDGFVESTISYHITIYQAKFATQDKDYIIWELQSIKKDHLPFDMQISGLNKKWNYIGLRFNKSQNIYNLQDGVIKLLNTYRDGRIKSTYINNVEWFSDAEKYMIELYGYPYVYDEFVPHVTLWTMDNVDEHMAKMYILEWNIYISQMEFVIFCDGNKEIIKL